MNNMPKKKEPSPKEVIDTYQRWLINTAEQMLYDQEWNHEAIDFWLELKAKLFN
jgi:hypothetical protein